MKITLVFKVVGRQSLFCLHFHVLMVANFKPITMKPCELAERANFYHLSSGMRNDKREMEGAKNSNFLQRDRQTGKIPPHCKETLFIYYVDLKREELRRQTEGH